MRNKQDHNAPSRYKKTAIYSFFYTRSVSQAERTFFLYNVGIL